MKAVCNCGTQAQGRAKYVMYIMEHHRHDSPEADRLIFAGYPDPPGMDMVD